MYLPPEHPIIDISNNRIIFKMLSYRKKVYCSILNMLLNIREVFDRPKFDHEIKYNMAAFLTLFTSKKLDNKWNVQ